MQIYSEKLLIFGEKCWYVYVTRNQGMYYMNNV